MRLTLLSCLIFFFCKSQQIEISVTNIDGKAIENINVQFLKDKKILDFKQTDVLGKCIFERPEAGVFSLKLTSVFYKTKVVDIDTRETRALTISLDSQITEIEQVEIKSRPKLARIKKDTIFFNVNAFKDGTERTTEDLIKKIPGLDINENGKVIYKGNTIGQVLVEGNEFFGKNHKLSTQNISADMIEGIDLWRNYTTINGNSSTALNLKLKEEYRGKVKGNVEVNYGTGNFYQGHINLFKLDKIGNLALLGDANSIAKDPIDFTDFQEMNSLDDVNNTDNPSNVDIPTFLNNDGKVKSKENQFGALQYSKSGKKISITVFSIFNQARLNKFSTTRRTVFDGEPEDFNFFEQKIENNKGLLGTTQIKIKKNITDKNFLYYNFGYAPTEDYFNQKIDRVSNEDRVFDIQNNVKNNKFSHFLSWNKQTGRSRMILAFAQVKEFYSEKLDVSSNHNVFLTDNNSLLQDNKITSDNYKLDFYLKNKNNWINFNFQSGISYKKDISELLEDVSKSNEIRNLKTFHYINGLNLYKQLGQFEMSATLSSNYLDVNSNNKHYFEKKGKIKFVPASKINTEFAIEYDARYQLPTFKILQNNPLYTKDLSFYYSLSLTPETFSKTDSYKFIWNRFNFDTRNMVFVMMGYDKVKPSFTTDITNYGTFSSVENVLGKYNDRWFLFLSNDYKISKNLIIKSKLSGILNKNSNFINSNPNISTIKNLEISQKISTDFKNYPFQLDLGYTFTKINFEQSFSKTSSTLDNLRLSLGIRAKIKKEWLANILSEYFLQKTDQDVLKNYLLGGQISYRKEKSYLEYNLLFNNLLNLDSFNYINSYTNQLGFNEFSTTALKGYFLAGLKLYF